VQAMTIPLPLCYPADYLVVSGVAVSNTPEIEGPMRETKASTNQRTQTIRSSHKHTNRTAFDTHAVLSSIIRVVLQYFSKITDTVPTQQTTTSVVSGLALEWLLLQGP
jgi:hypothetical protein